jgi:hypothetical protein
MFRSKEGRYQYFIVTDAETHLIEERNSDNPVVDQSFFTEKLNSEFLMSPSWEAVGAYCFTEFREDKSSVTTYISNDILYDWKKPIFDSASEVAGREFPNTFHEIVELPPHHFPELEGQQTFSRGDDGKWIQKDVPSDRAIFANKSKEMREIEGYSVSLDHLDRPYIQMSSEEDRFIHFCSSEEAEEIESNKTISVDGEKGLWTSSVLWGGDTPISKDTTSAVVFQTSQNPSFAHPQKGALWKGDIELADMSFMDSSSASQANPLSPVPTPEKIRDRFDGEFEEDPVPYIKYSSSVRKEARLPLGEPGGPCQVLYNIEESDLPDSVEDELREEVYEDGKLLDKEHEVYSNQEIQADIPPFTTILLTSHAQHKMDLRAIREEDVKSAFEEFSKWFMYRKNNPSSLSKEDERKIKDLQTRGETIKFEGNRTGLTLVFDVGNRPDKVRLVTTWWEGLPDPDPPDPGECAYLLEKQSTINNVVSRYIQKRSSCGCGEDCECDGECDCEGCGNDFQIE